MAEIILLLTRTVFLPKGSPGICTVRQIRADINRFDVQSEGGRVFCSGETDLLIEYLSFAEGEHYPGYEEFEQRIPGGGSMWQALLSLPFELSEDGEVPCPAEAQLKVGEMKWYMVAPHALEMEMELLLCWEIAAEPAPAPLPGDWQQISLGDIKVTLGGERLSMQNEEKLMRMGVAGQIWDLDTEPQPKPPSPPETKEAEAAVADETVAIEEDSACAVADEAVAIEEIIITKDTLEEILAEQPLAEELVTEELVTEELVIEEFMAEELVTEELVIEELLAEQPAAKDALEIQPKDSAAPPVIIQTVETPYQPQPQPQPEMSEGLLAGLVAEAKEEEQARPASGRRLAGLPRLVVRREKVSQSYQVNFHIEEP